MQRPVVPGSQGDVLPPKRQATLDRLRRRIENYRRHQSDCIPKFDQTFNGLVEQNFQDTLVLKQRFLENKAKRTAKKTDKKTPENNLQGNAHPVSSCGPLPGSPCLGMLFFRHFRRENKVSREGPSSGRKPTGKH
ncbi:hypothetical protein LSTR_LSTR004239 [Laodelphax striatellus]|uniref:Neurogenic mastermind-like N-terminal domain-containing protein n=1 Tax=Laodelphax striatellus TaxID=195883 RepID=A0A482XD59_LAOST|nr:hypothetical protein LSTR_LSTR004239 [Laodelphax striatellus]